MKPAEIESPVSSLISNEFEEFASLHIAKKSLDFQVNLALQLLRGRYSPPQTQAQDMFPSCLRTAVSCCKVSSFSTGSKETSWRLHLGGQMQEVVMSNTHLTSSLLENYSTVNRFMIYTDIISSIFNLKPGFVGRKPQKTPPGTISNGSRDQCFPFKLFLSRCPFGTRGGRYQPCRADLPLPCAIQPAMPGRLLDGEVVRSRRRCELIPPFLFLNLKSLGPDSDLGG